MMLSLAWLLMAPSLVCGAASRQEPGDVIEPRSHRVEGLLSERHIDSSLLASPSLRKRLMSASKGGGCSAVCETLGILLAPDQVLQKNVSAYRTFSDTYWSTVQRSAHPSCIVKPSNASEVALAVDLVRFTGCHFAVKSGGHAPFPNASSTSEGITISMERFRDIQLSNDRKSVFVGAGNTWGPLYQNLGQYGLTVSGGRVSSVGVGGLALGGGLSYIVNLYGWACDNIASYEIVTADGRILTVSPTEHADLYFALRGGGSNFGIVTKYNLFTYSLPEASIWGGARTYAEADAAAVVSAFTDMANHAGDDLYASNWLAFSSSNGTRTTAAWLCYAKQNGKEAPIFSKYNAIPTIGDEARNQKLVDVANEQGRETPAGFRQHFFTITFKNDQAMNNIAREVFFRNYDAFEKVNASVRLLYQSITHPQLLRMRERGGNPLGLSATHEALTLVMFPATWEHPEHDHVIYTTGSRILDEIKGEASKRNLTTDYLYLNYAAPWQDVIAGYGQTNKQKLLQVARTYDPDGVFQRLQPGGIKLNQTAESSPASLEHRTRRRQ